MILIFRPSVTQLYSWPFEYRLQPRFGDKPFKFEVVYLQNGAAVLKGFKVKRAGETMIASRSFSGTPMRGEKPRALDIYMYDLPSLMLGFGRREMSVSTESSTSTPLTATAEATTDFAALPAFFSPCVT